MQSHAVSRSSAPTSGRRLVPDQLRKRAAVSCDFCKTRRRKCQRTSPQGPCRLCRDNRIECVSSIRRQSRHRGASEGQSARHQALEDLVGKLFPDVSLDDPRELTRLCQAVENNDLMVSGDLPPLSLPDSGPSATSPPQHNDSTAEQYRMAERVQEARSEPPSTGVCYELMLQNPHGTLSYFGSSGSMAYVRQMRELLALRTTQDPEPLEDGQKRLHDDFIHDRYSHTMGEDEDMVPELQSADQAHRPNATTRSQRQSPEANNRLLKLAEVLPARDETDELVELFFNHVHNNITLFHRPTLETMLERLRSPDTAGIDAGWAVCIRLVLAFGCERRSSSSPLRVDPSEPARLLSLRRQLVSGSLAEVPYLILSTTLQSVTALTLLSIYLSFANERNASWAMSGCAIRMAMGMGLHRGENVLRRSNILLSPMERELHKQVWCSLYIFEQYTSALLGRPSAVDGIDILTELPRESLLDQGFYRPPGLLQHDVSLARIISSVRRAQVNQSLDISIHCDGLPSLETCDTILRDLDEWRSGLPPFLEFNGTNQQSIYPNHLRQIVMIHVRYQYTRILLSRPFLLKAVHVSHVLKQPQAVSDPINKFKQLCFQAASDSWMLIRSLWENNQYNATLWLDGVFAYQCTLILSLYMLDKTGTDDVAHQGQLQAMVEQMMEILQKGPGNRTMRRLVQISRDFNDIVSLSSPSSAVKQKLHHGVNAGSGSRTSLGQTPTDTGGVQELDINTASLNLESLMDADWLQDNYMDDNFGFDISMADFGLQF